MLKTVTKGKMMGLYRFGDGLSRLRKLGKPLENGFPDIRADPVSVKDSDHKGPRRE